MIFFKQKFVAVVMAVAMSPSLVLANNIQHKSGSNFGQLAADAAAIRTVNITSKTKYINVNQGDIIKFNVDGKVFTWQFDTFYPDDSFKLASIVPEGVDVPDIYVYVAPNPLYRN